MGAIELSRVRIGRRDVTGRCAHTSLTPIARIVFPLLILGGMTQERERISNSLSRPPPTQTQPEAASLTPLSDLQSTAQATLLALQYRIAHADEAISRKLATGTVLERLVNSIAITVARIIPIDDCYPVHNLTGTHAMRQIAAHRAKYNTLSREIREQLLSRS